METINIKDLTKGYQEQVGEAYYYMAEEAAERILQACNKLVAEGLRGDELQEGVNMHLKTVAEAMCVADGEVDKKTGKPLDTAADLTRLYLLDRIDEVCEDMSPDCGSWQVTGEGDERQLAFVADGE